MQKYYTYVLYLLMSILVVTLYLNDFSPIASLQRSLNDVLCRVTAEDGVRPNVVMIKVDGRAQDAYGEWPWNRDLIADLAAATANGSPKAIVLDVNLPEDPDQDTAGYNRILADQIGWIDNIILPYDLSRATYQGKRTSNPKYLFNNSIAINNPVGIMPPEASLLGRKVFLPAEKLLGQEPWLGFVYQEPDDDQILRRQPLLMNYEGYYYPSVGLIAAASYLGVTPDQIEATQNQLIKLGLDRTVPMGDRSNFFVRFASGQAFQTYSAADILSEEFDRSRLAGKLVFIGPDDLNALEYFDTPTAAAVTAMYVHATVAENIINQNFITEDPLPAGFDLLILFALGGLCAFLLPRVTLSHRLMILFGLLVVTANLTYFMLSSFSVLTETLYFAFEIIVFMAAAPMLDSELITGEVKAQKASRKKVPRAKARSIDNETDAVPVREIRTSASDPESQETTAMALDDDHRPFAHPTDGKTKAAEIGGKTTAVKGHAEDHKEADELVISSGRGDSPDRVIESSGKEKEPIAKPASKSEVTDSQRYRTPINAADIKNLGRYQVIEVLGKGAMGLVYKGVDPAINRAVALKTIRLDFVNDPEEMEDLKERLFREAQAAGKLSHPNIVTIYDVGSEGPLQYIAMEFLEGQTLEEMIRKKTNFNYRIIAQIIVQICSALDYAHDMGIIHRDIKPANIMVLPDYRIKVMDYGIAKIDSHSMTKTGIAMGTPNYISPEQLKGLKPDRRGDIFSLGVVMYEMLLGKRPFKGENITSLIYSILNTEPEKPSTINPQIPLIFDRILEKSLAKNPDSRFQRASEVAECLEDFVESFVNR